MKMILHDFYCIKCGNKGLSLMRNHGHKHQRFHRKKLYCPHCKCEINHIECRNEEDAYEFKMAFEKGEYVNEVEESLAFIRSAGLG